MLPLSLLPNFSDPIGLLALLALVVIGIIIIIFIVKILLFILPAAILAFIVWLITDGNMMLAGLAFIIVAVISIMKR